MPAELQDCEVWESDIDSERLEGWGRHAVVTHHFLHVGHDTLRKM